MQADFGALNMRKKSCGAVAVTTEMESLRHMLDSPIHQRLIEVLESLNPKAGGTNQQEAPKKWRRHIEWWSKAPLCSITKQARKTTVDVEDPATALQTASLDISNNVIVLGREKSDRTTQQGLNLNR